MNKIKYLLLGGGYTLSGLAGSLDPGEFVITATSAGKVNLFRERGFNAELLDIKDASSIKNLFNSYPELQVIIDSIPPLNEENKELQNFANMIKDTSVKRIIYFSTTGVFGVTDGSWVNESSEVRPNNPKSLSRYNAERIYSALNLDFCAFRIAAIYGPGRGIEIALKNKTYRMVEDGSGWSNRIHVSDIIEACKKAITMSINEKLPPVLCLSDSKPSKIKDIVNYYCSKYGYERPVSIRHEEATRLGMHSIVSNQRVDNSLLKNFLGKDLKVRSYIEGV